MSLPDKWKEILKQSAADHCALKNSQYVSFASSSGGLWVSGSSAELDLSVSRHISARRGSNVSTDASIHSPMEIFHPNLIVKPSETPSEPEILPFLV